jgi:hypothetical protein
MRLPRSIESSTAHARRMSAAMFDIVAIVALIVCAELQRRRIPMRESTWFTHRIGGTERATRRTFMTLQASDFCDYLVMLAITAAVSTQMYGMNHPLNALNVALCIALAIAFPVRHGVVWRLPTIVSEPWHALNVLFSKLDNFTPALPLAIAVMLAERAAIRMWPEFLLGSADLVYVQYAELVFYVAVSPRHRAALGDLLRACAPTRSCVCVSAPISAAQMCWSCVRCISRTC